MKPVFQTSFFDPEDETRGNCLHACIASIFEWSIDFLDLPNPCYSQDVIDWTNRYWPGWQCVDMDYRTNYLESSKPTEERPEGGWVYDDPSEWFAPHYGYWIGTIYSPRIKRPKSDPYWPRSGLHAVVMKGYKLAHDPHPEGLKEIGDETILGALYWVVSDPALALTSTAERVY